MKESFKEHKFTGVINHCVSMEKPAKNKQVQVLSLFETQEYVQLNKYKTDPYIPQIFQSNTSVCLIISVFCKSCEPMLCEPEIVQKFCS